MNYNHTDTPEKYIHFFWANNKITNPADEYIIHLAEPRCLIKLRVDLPFNATFDEFYNSIAEVQWIDGVKPSDLDQSELLTNAWEYLCIEERIFNDDIEAINIDNDNDDDF